MPKSKKRSTVSKSKFSFKRKHPSPEMKSRLKNVQEAKEMNLKYVMVEDDEYLKIYDSKTKKQIKDKAVSAKLSKIYNENRK